MVDDYKADRRNVNGMLTKLCCIVDEAEIGERALEFVRENNYSIILMEVHMPGIDDLIAKSFMKKELLSIVKMHFGRQGCYSTVFEMIDINIGIGQTSEMMDQLDCNCCSISR